MLINWLEAAHFSGGSGSRGVHPANINEIKFLDREMGDTGPGSKWMWCGPMTLLKLVALSIFGYFTAWVRGYSKLEKKIIEVLMVGILQ